jgi:hypothetical protein
MRTGNEYKIRVWGRIAVQSRALPCTCPFPFAGTTHDTRDGQRCLTRVRASADPVTPGPTRKGQP